MASGGRGIEVAVLIDCLSSGRRLSQSEIGPDSPDILVFSR